MRPRSTLDELHARPGTVVATWSQIASADLIDMLGGAGYDATFIDLEHGAFGVETAEGLIRACEAAGVTPLVRVPRGDHVALYKSLDAGAAGVLMPGVESAEEAAAAVAAARFAPQGRRGACPIVRAAGHAATAWPRFVAQQQGVGVLVMIETNVGVQACEAICAVPGLKAVMAGPFDLSVSLGCGGDVQAPAVQAALQRVLRAAQAAGLPLWMPVFHPEPGALAAAVRAWHQQGVRHLVVGADKIVIGQAFARWRGVARGEA